MHRPIHRRVAIRTAAAHAARRQAAQGQDAADPHCGETGVMDATDIAREGRERKVLDTEKDDPTAKREYADLTYKQQVSDDLEIGVTA